jgi:hypothetical protein
MPKKFRELAKKILKTFPLKIFKMCTQYIDIARKIFIEI